MANQKKENLRKIGLGKDHGTSKGKGDKESQAAALAFDTLDALKAPIILKIPENADRIPANLHNAILEARKIHFKQGIQNATWEEATAFLLSVAVQRPLHGPWANIFSHISCTTAEKWLSKNLWEFPGVAKTLDKWEQKMLHDLLRDIYHSRRDALRKQIAADKKARFPGRRSRSGGR